MCYDERLFRSWTMKMAQKRESQQVTERDRLETTPIRTATAAETKPPGEVKRELEEIV